MQKSKAIMSIFGDYDARSAQNNRKKQARMDT